jgi:hypothetical protein
MHHRADGLAAGMHRWSGLVRRSDLSCGGSRLTALPIGRRLATHPLHWVIFRLRMGYRYRYRPGRSRTD